MKISHISLIDLDPEKLWQDTSAKSVSFFCRRRPVRVDGAVIAELRELSRRHDGKNVRLCLHDGPTADHHDMIILERQGKYYRPHKHAAKGEAFHVIAGQLGVLAFADDGMVVDACALGPGDIYRVEVNMYHAVLPLSAEVIYHENKPGPFTGEGDSIFPDWAPDGTDPTAFGQYVDSLRRRFNPATG